MGLARTGGTDQEDVGLFDDDIPQVGVGDDRIGSFTVPGIDEALVVIADAQGEPPLGDVLTDDVLVQVSDQGLGRRDRCQKGFLRWSLRRRCGLGTG